jgi:hypothetical protein
LAKKQEESIKLKREDSAKYRQEEATVSRPHVLMTLKHKIKSVKEMTTFVTRLARLIKWRIQQVKNPDPTTPILTSCGEKRRSKIKGKL